jgi:hypothetical protein
MDFFKNITVNLRATGASAVLIAWLLCFTAITLFGTGINTGIGQGVLTVVGMVLIKALGEKI